MLTIVPVNFNHDEDRGAGYGFQGGIGMKLKCEYCGEEFELEYEPEPGYTFVCYDCYEAERYEYAEGKEPE
jgi:hypothetical protein